MEFKVNEVVVHCREGLSTIVGETEIAGNAYFVIVSRKNPKENIFLSKLTSNIKNILFNKNLILLFVMMKMIIYMLLMWKIKKFFY